MKILRNMAIVALVCYGASAMAMDEARIQGEIKWHRQHITSLEDAIEDAQPMTDLDFLWRQIRNSESKIAELELQLKNIGKTPLQVLEEKKKALEDKIQGLQNESSSTQDSGNFLGYERIQRDITNAEAELRDTRRQIRQLQPK